MKNNTKKILAILLLLVIALVIAGLFILSSRLSTTASVAPTAPVSLPQAAEDNWGADARCNGTFTVTATVCVPDGTKTCTPDCPTACGKAASTISTCTDSCGVATTKACAATVACAGVTIEKKAFQNESGNSAGNYNLKTEIDTVAKNQTFVYSLTVTNHDATSSATGVAIKDPLTGENQDMLSFVDKIDGCDFDVASKTLTCNTDLATSEAKIFSFRTKVLDGAVNGSTIKNIATVTHLGKNQSAEKDLLVSTVVSCDHTCTGDAECSGGLTCDTSTYKCRNTACANIESCVCPTAAAPRGPSVPREVVIRVTTTPRPTVLPESGILDFPGVAAFGGGLLLAIVGILLAL